MFTIDPNRLDLALEFRRKPFGEHSADLQAVLNAMRSLPADGKHLLVMTKPHREWTLARMEGDPPRPALLDEVFASLEDAEWHVFRLRWEALTGQPLNVNE
ncbi:MAG: hypothetical protein RIM84_26235 [Alphaproteobacteria bacterium]